MKHLRTALTVFISVSLITLSPGLGAYRACASMIGAATAVKGSAAGVNGAVGAAVGNPALIRSLSVTPVNLNLNSGVLPGMSSLPGSVIAPHAGVRLAPSLMVQTQISGAAAALPLKAALSVKTSRAPPAAKKTQSLLKSLSLALPKFGEMSGAEAKSSAQTDFLSRIGSYKSRGESAAVAPKASVFQSLRRGMRLSAAKKSSKKEDMPDYGRDDDRSSEPDYNDLDELGNERRRQDPGPDDGYDEFGGDGGRGNSDLFGFMPLVFAGSSLFIAPLLGALSLPVMIGTYLAVVLPSLVLHEMGHAWAADKLGDPSARLAGRMSFSPRNLWNHLNMPLSFNLFGRQISIPLGMSFVLPLGMMTISMLTVGVPILFGGARPVQVNSGNLASPAQNRTAAKGMGLVALAGPAVNFGIAALAGLTHFGLMAAGVGGAVLPVLAASVFLNVLLGVFNLLPFAPLDGHHVGRSFLADTLGRPDWAEKAYGSAEGYMSPAARAVNIYGLIGTVLFMLGPVLGAVHLISSVFLAGSSWLVSSGALAASGVLPAVGALGLMVGQILGGGSTMGGNSDGAKSEPAVEIPDARELIVRFDGAKSKLSADHHLSLVDVGAQGGMRLYQATVQGMMAQLHLSGLDMSLLHRFGATPIATYKRINAATLRMPASQKDAMKQALTARGFKVYENERREIVRPIEDDPNVQMPQAAPQRGAVSMKETLEISTMDKVHEAARQRWGSPQRSDWRARLLNFLLTKVLRGSIAQPNIGVIDTGVEKDHPLIAPGLKAAKDVDPNGSGADRNGHGTWVTSMVFWFAPWLKNITHYKIFGDNGGATLDDVLKGLTMAGNDKNIVISNSWGSDDGDPNSPDSMLVKKLAEEGHIMVFAAGNAGYRGANTIGSPAISHYVDAKTGAPRVIAIASTDRNKAVSSFSSKGPGSRKTRNIPDYPRKPNAAEQGDNTEGAWLGGRTRAISGTSMSTPKFAGTIAMLAQLFGVTEVGEDLDRIVNAVMGTLVNPKNETPTAIGDGFSAAYAAYERLNATGFMPVKRGLVRRLLIWLLDRAQVGGEAPKAPPAPAADERNVEK
ncbi:MAG: S8 family serine peptidase [Elusimicrobiota bacterium]